jgi:hypothetical protein
MTICRNVTAIWLTSDPPAKISLARWLMFLRRVLVQRMAAQRLTRKKTKTK